MTKIKTKKVAPTADDLKLAEEMRTFREVFNLTTSEVAPLLYVSRKTIENIEQGRFSFRYPDLLRQRMNGLIAAVNGTQGPIPGWQIRLLKAGYRKPLTADHLIEALEAPNRRVMLWLDPSFRVWLAAAFEGVIDEERETIDWRSDFKGVSIDAIEPDFLTTPDGALARLWIEKNAKPPIKNQPNLTSTPKTSRKSKHAA